ncbi:MAG: hypothetical protein LBE78_03695, partial [Burkholderiaceae bacterium]|nr:hypothetical protein [Burkholderiaceae bacterium]
MANPPTQPTTTDTKKSRFLKICCSVQKHQQIQYRAVEARMTVSKYVRRATIGRQIVAKDAAAMFRERAARMATALGITVLDDDLQRIVADERSVIQSKFARTPTVRHRPSRNNAD